MTQLALTQIQPVSHSQVTSLTVTSTRAVYKDRDETLWPHDITALESVDRKFMYRDLSPRVRPAPPSRTAGVAAVPQRIPLER